MGFVSRLDKTIRVIQTTTLQVFIAFVKLAPNVDFFSPGLVLFYQQVNSFIKAWRFANTPFHSAFNLLWLRAVLNVTQDFGRRVNTSIGLFNYYTFLFRSIHLSYLFFLFSASLTALIEIQSEKTNAMLKK